MSTLLTPGQSTADAVPVGRLRRAASASIARLGGTRGGVAAGRRARPRLGCPVRDAHPPDAGVRRESGAVVVLRRGVRACGDRRHPPQRPGPGRHRLARRFPARDRLLLCGPLDARAGPTGRDRDRAGGLPPAARRSSSPSTLRCSRSRPRSRSSSSGRLRCPRATTCSPGGWPRSRAARSWSWSARRRSRRRSRCRSASSSHPPSGPDSCSASSPRSSNTSAALIAVLFLRTRPEELWLVLAPAIVVGLGYRAYANQRDRQARIEFLYDCARILQRPFLDAATLTEMLTRTRAMLHAEVAEIAAVRRRRAERRPTRAVVGQAGVIEAGHGRSSGEVLQQRLALLAPGGHGVLFRRPIRDRAVAARFARAGLTDAVVVPLRGDAGVVGTLTVREPRRVPRPVRRRRTCALMETLGVHAGVALQNSGLVDRLADSLANVTQLGAAVQSSDDAILALGPTARSPPGTPRPSACSATQARSSRACRRGCSSRPSSANRSRQSFGGITAGQAERRGTSEVVRRDGTHLPVSVTVSPIMDGTGALVGLSAIVHDETARREAEAVLREREEQFRTVFRLGPIGMVMVDEQGTWTAVNDALSKLLERPPDHLVGQPSDAFVEPDDVADMRLREAELFASPGVGGYAVERRYRTAGGRIVWARVTERPLRSAATGPGGTICMIEDITESRLAAERVRDTEARLHRAVTAFTAVREPTSVLRAVLAAARDLLDAEFAAIGVLCRGRHLDRRPPLRGDRRGRRVGDRAVADRVRRARPHQRGHGCLSHPRRSDAPGLGRCPARPPRDHVVRCGADRVRGPPGRPTVRRQQADRAGVRRGRRRGRNGARGAGGGRPRERPHQLPDPRADRGPRSRKRRPPHGERREVGVPGDRVARAADPAALDPDRGRAGP